LLLEYGIVVNLLGVLPILGHLLLDIDNQRVLVPNTVHALGLYERVADIIASYSTENAFDVTQFNPISLFLYNIKSLKQVSILLHGVLSFSICLLC